MQKTMRDVVIKSADKGEVSAVFSTFNVIDKDGDVTLPGAIQDGAEVVISAYGHASHGGALPVGKGTIRTTNTEAVLHGQFFMNTTAGRDTFEVVKQLGGQQEWSYSLHNVKAHSGQFDGQDVQFLESIYIKEVSPVLVGAGVGTRTLGVKTAPDNAGDAMTYRGAIRPHETPVSRKAWTPETFPDLGEVAALRAKHAWVDTAADPEAAASYKFAHHDSDGAANVRACMVGIARLKAGNHGIPAGDVEGVFEHLAGHLREADIEPSDLKSAATLHDQLLDALVGVLDATDAAGRVASVRAVKGKTLSQVNTEVLVWMEEALRGLKALIDTPEEVAAREFLRFMRDSL